MSYGKRNDWLNRTYKNNKTDNTQQAKKIVLFDMDGTLTSPRQPFDDNLFQPLSLLSEKSHIGIVTGSDMEYLEQQMDFVLNSHLRYKLHLLPCNGTKYYPPPFSSSDKYSLKSSMNMIDYLGQEHFHDIMRTLISMQNNFDCTGIPLTGHFIQYRGSMINWCPIGRNAKSDDRNKFIEYDTSFSPPIRNRLLDSLNSRLSIHADRKPVTVKLGGDTSFDIFPSGWDKTYALKYFNKWEVWFVGDRCDLGGNDKEIYDHLVDTGKSYKTKDTHNTKLIIENEILPKI